MPEQVELGPLGTPMSLPQSQARLSRPESPNQNGHEVAANNIRPEVEPPTGGTNVSHQEGEAPSQSLWRYTIIALLNKRAAIGITTLTLALTCFSLWPNFTAQHDTRSALTLAEWTAQKDFLEWCSAQREDASITEDCIAAKSAGLPPPPSFSNTIEHQKREALAFKLLSHAYEISNIAFFIIVAASIVLWMTVLLRAGIRLMDLNISNLLGLRAGPRQGTSTEPSTNDPDNRDGNKPVATTHGTHKHRPVQATSETVAQRLPGITALVQSLPEQRNIGLPDIERDAWPRTSPRISYTQPAAAQQQPGSLLSDRYTGAGQADEPPAATARTSAPSWGFASGSNFRWWIPAEGIRRDVIQADIQRYLGPDALVRPGEGRDNNKGRPGYWIAAYRTLTPAMIQDLKADSANFERSGDSGIYENSMVHRSRQHWGPTGDSAASYGGGSSTGYATTSSYSSAPESYGLYATTTSASRRPGAYGGYGTRASGPPGYYLASDGNFYPESARPTYS